MTLYKYLVADRADILELEHIRYTQPVFLNDPFEMTPNFNTMFSDGMLANAFRGQVRQKAVAEFLTKIPKRLHRRAKFLAWFMWIVKRKHMRAMMKTMAETLAAQFRQEFPKLIDQHLRRKAGVLSLTSRNDNLLMWTHYADQHRGFVLAINEKHPIFNQRRSDKDEMNHLREVQYSDHKTQDLMQNMDGVDLLLRKSPEWAHEKEWRIVRPLEDASAILARDHMVHLYSLPPDAIEGVIYGAHISPEDRDRIRAVLHSRESYDHVWERQAEVAAERFGLDFLKMPTRPKLYGPLNAQLRIHDLDEETGQTVRALIETLAPVMMGQPLDLTRLRYISVDADIITTIGGMIKQKWHGSEDAQVLAGAAGDEADVYMYLRAGEFKKWEDYTEDEKKRILHFMHRKFAMVHNITMRYRSFGEKMLTEALPGIGAYLAPVALNCWNDYAVARLSASSMPIEKVTTFIPDAAKIKTESQVAIAEAIKAYRTHAQLNALLGVAAKHIQDYLGKIAETVGYADGGAPMFQTSLIEGMKAVAGPSHVKIVEDYIAALRRMWRYYPVWENFSIYDDLVYTVRAVEFSWGIAMRDEGKDVHVAVP